MDEWAEQIFQQIRKYEDLVERKANVYLVYGEVTSMQLFFGFLFTTPSSSLSAPGKVWVFTSQWDFSSLSIQKNWHLQTFHGALSFTVHSNEPLGFQHFLDMVKPSWIKGDALIQFFWEQVFNCSLQEPDAGMNSLKNCTEEEKLENIPGNLFEMHMTGHSYSIYNAVYAVAHGLDAMDRSRFKHKHLVERRRLALQNVQAWQVILLQIHNRF